MGFFKEVEGEAAVLVEKGVYRQVPLFTRDGYLYAKWGAGFVRLMADGSTTRPSLRLDSLTWTGALCRDGLGRLSLSGTELDDDRMKRLTGPAS